MNAKANSISRRTILRGLGASIAIPWLEIMSGKTLAAARGKSDPGRLACFYVPGCINHYNWFPVDTGFQYAISPTHEPLARHRERFSVLTSLSHIEGRISGHPHPYNFLTGHNINITPGVLSNSVSMDQVAAKYIGPTYLPSLVLSWTSGVGAATLSRNALGVDIPATSDYRSIFENLFPPADASHLKQAKARLVLNRSILDTAVGDVKDLQRRLGRADQQRMEQYLTSIREVEKRLDDREAILKKGRPSFDETSVQTEPKSKSSMRDHIELMIDLIVLAFQTDMTRVVTQTLGGEAGPSYDEYKEWAKTTGAPTRGVHDYHHKGSGNRGVDNSDTKLIGLRDRMYCECLARLMDKLAAIEASDGTLLDHTVLLLGGSQISSHSGSNFPLLLAGGNKLGFRHGQHLKWKGNERSASDLYLTILQQLRCPVESFKESKGPITELLV
ncbi:hypothetical protein ETAA8_01270 [Anatilimnocola aggregata]|uniref:DUF1552 domain-containing protein n=1 Tax=Anatilimnocola aggregata TaxID=2528021 RepID=A0A517Y4E0_9BACT|nr:DUF1552 domain-containing protein [Anatilimnocola aggregata]QDU25066.1 hypothetical protein ETAA8_01270 [Anatilimnocola aggregata]